VDAAIADFVADNPGVFYDPTDPANGILDIDGLTQEIIDISATHGFDAFKASLATKDGTGNASLIDVVLSNVWLNMAVSMGNGSDGLSIGEVQVGQNATLTTGNGDDTIIVVGLGGLAADGFTTFGPPTLAMNQFQLTTGDGSNAVVISLDWEGDPGYAPAYGIDAAVQNCIAANPSIASSLQAVDGELDAAAEAMLGSSSPQSLNASHAYLTIGNSAGAGTNVVTLSDILVSPSTIAGAATNRLSLNLGGGDDYVYFYDNAWDGAFADLNGGGGSNTLDENRGGNSGSDTTIVNFQTVIPDEAL
jgi:hypothetical protein